MVKQTRPVHTAEVGPVRRHVLLHELTGISTLGHRLWEKVRMVLAQRPHTNSTLTSKGARLGQRIITEHAVTSDVRSGIWR